MFSMPTDRSIDMDDANLTFICVMPTWIERVVVVVVIHSGLYVHRDSIRPQVVSDEKVYDRWVDRFR